MNLGQLNIIRMDLAGKPDNPTGLCVLKRELEDIYKIDLRTLFTIE